MLLCISIMLFVVSTAIYESTTMDKVLCCQLQRLQRLKSMALVLETCRKPMIQQTAALKMCTVLCPWSRSSAWRMNVSLSTSMESCLLARRRKPAAVKGQGSGHWLLTLWAPQELYQKTSSRDEWAQLPELWTTLGRHCQQTIGFFRWKLPGYCSQGKWKKKGLQMERKWNYIENQL